MAITKPIRIIEGASRILLKLKIASLKYFGSSLPPPIIKIKPIAIIKIERNRN
jgi:hypothetical protein